MAHPSMSPRKVTGALRPGILALAGAVVLGLAPGAALAAPSSSSTTAFSTSFESSDPAPSVSTTWNNEISNVNGSTLSPHSLIPLVTQTSASAQNSPNETVDKLTDMNSGTKWLAFQSTGWAQYQLSEAASVDSYTLTSANDSQERDPQDFTLQGSTDGNTWTILDTQTGVTWMDGSNSNRLTSKTFKLTARSSAYSFYRLNITKNAGNVNIIQIADWDLQDSQRTSPTTPMAAFVDSGPTSSDVAKTGVGFSGTKALHYRGSQVVSGEAKATDLLLDTNVAVTEGMELNYKLFPVLDSGITYSSTYAAIDLVLDDGSRLSTSGATDAYGFGADAKSQGAANVLWPDQWNSVTVDLSKLAGRTVKQILLSYDNPAGAAGTAFQGWVDDISIRQTPTRDTSDGLVSYVDTRRGTNSTGGYSRGNNLPATAWPNGFNFITPMTNADNTGTLYNYQRTNDENNMPGLTGIGLSHEPSIWMGDRDQLALMPVAGDSPDSSLAARRLTFSHDDEVARPDVYSVTFTNGMKAEATPTDHGAVFRFTFTGDKGSVLVDQVAGSSKLSVSQNGVVTGWVDGGSDYPGRTRMFVYGTFDTTPLTAGTPSAGDRSGARYAAFDTSTTKTVELRLASSFISQDQAEKNLDLEVTGRSFEDVQKGATAAWNARLGAVTDVTGASDQQLVTLYSSLYRVNLYPNSQFENTGTAANPVYKYASPVASTVGSATDTQTNAQIKDGKIYVNNGFWDTYRTEWPAYAMLYPKQTQELVNGFVQQYRDSGWVARWSSPGYANLMTGTSSDVSFAEAYMDGSIDTKLALEAYDAAVKNATARPDSDAVGRNGINTSIFLGYTPITTGQSVSWALEGYINDYGISQMAAKLATDPNTPADRVGQLQEESKYFGDRAGHYAEMFNSTAGTFTARNADGTWPYGADYNTQNWNGDVTESAAWTFGFHAPFDVNGLAALYGGRTGLLKEIDSYLSTQERAQYSGIHEAREARDVRLGMLAMSNQTAHHIPYLLAEAGDPSGAQKLIRNITQRLFVGSDIGQGYPGDEDNGEFSAWFVYSALGFYPLEVGSGNYTFGSPLFDSATVHMGDKTLKISAPGASQGKVYVSGVSINGTPVTTTTVDGSLIRNGGTLTFSMSSQPSTWGDKDLSEKLTAPTAMVDATSAGLGATSAADGTPVGKLVDNDMDTSVVFPGSSSTIRWDSASGPVIVDQYTLTSTKSASPPSKWTLEGSLDGKNWTTVDSRTGQTFPDGTQTRPFGVPTAGQQAFTHFRLKIDADSGSLGLAEIELFAKATMGGGLTVTPASDLTAQTGQSFAGSLATIAGVDGDGQGLTATVTYGDGSAPVTATLKKNALGSWEVSAPHSFAKSGTYTFTVTASNGSNSTAQASGLVVVSRDLGLVGAFNNTCIADPQNGASCDAQSSGFIRSSLADSGFVQGQTTKVGSTGLSFDLPAFAAGSPDNVTDEGQTINVDLGEGATRISFIGTATENNKDLTATLTFSDGTTQTVPYQFGDWVGAAGSPRFGNIVVGSSNGRMIGTSPESSIKVSAVFATTPVDLDKDASGKPKTVVSVTLPTETGTLRYQGRVHLFAVASDGTRSPIPDLVVTGGPVANQTAGKAFQANLATVSGGRATPGQTATVNWGDGSDLVTATITDGTVTSGHTYAKAGTYTVTVTVDDGTVSAAATTTVTVAEAPAPAAITVGGASFEPGADVPVTGTGFRAGEKVTVTLRDASTTVTADSTGKFTASITVPADTTSGTYTVSATGADSGSQASADITVAAAHVPATPTEVSLTGPEGKVVVGQGFGVTVRVSPTVAAGTVHVYEGDTEVGSTTVSGGAGVVSVKTASSGDHTFTARFVPDDATKFAPSTSDPVVVTVSDVPANKATIQLSASSRTIGESLGISGQGFTPGEKVTLTLGSAPIGLTTVNADASGTFQITVTVPAGASLGKQSVVATGGSSGLVAKAALTVSAKGAPSGHGSADGSSTDGGGVSDMPSTGAWGLGIIGVASVLLLGIGGFLRYRAGSRRRRSAD